MITEEQAIILELIRTFNGVGEVKFNHGVDWYKVFTFACQQGVSCLCYDALEKDINVKGRRNIPQEFILQLYAKKMSIKQTMQTKWLLTQEFAAMMQPSHCIVLKGIDYANYWPEPFYREFGDLDCWYDYDFDIVNENAVGKGAKVEYAGFKHTHIYYKNLMIENHHALTVYDGSNIGRLTENKLQSLLKECEPTSLQETFLLSPNPMFTVCFMLKHAQRHFMTEGIELRHFLDWIYFIDKCGESLDKVKVTQLLYEMKLTKFAAMMTAYCITRLGWGNKLVESLDLKVENSLLERVDEYVFEKKADVQNKNILYRSKRMLNRFVRAWHFRKLNCLPYYKAVWSSIAYASMFDRIPST